MTAVLQSSQAILCMGKKIGWRRVSSSRQPLSRIQYAAVDPSSPPPPPPPSSSSVDRTREKIILQPRVCTLRSYGSDAKRVGLIRENPSSTSPPPFLASLADYIENSRKSRDFEIISGRLAMLVFAVAVGTEMVTGDSLFKKIDTEELAGAIGVCMAVVVCSAAFASMSSTKAGIGKEFMLGCNNFVDSFVDNIIEGLFFDDDPSDWSDEV